MRIALHKALSAARCLIVALFALAQAIPSGFALAADGGGVDLVMCTADGLKTVSWEEVTGEPSPFETPADHEDRDCPACHTTCRVGAAVEPRLDYLSHPSVRHYPAAYRQAAAAPVLSTPHRLSGPRAPPQNLPV